MSRIFNYKTDVLFLCENQSGSNIIGTADVDGEAGEISRLANSRSVGKRDTGLVLKPGSEDFRWKRSPKLGYNN
jgi:hypothetical protein